VVGARQREILRAPDYAKGKYMNFNKVAIITGSSRGIGAETARLFAEHGYAVCINYISNNLAAEKVRDEIQQRGGSCISVQADVSVSSEVIRLFETVDLELGPVSVLINNAAILKTQSRFDDISEDRFLEILKTNVMSCFLCSKEAVKRMSTKYGGAGGTIVNVSSGASKSGSPNEYIDYAASKGAVDTLTRGLALEVAAEGIRVNAVRPGFIYTEMHSSGGEPNRVDRLKSKIPLQRGGQSKEVAEAIFWLATEKSAYVTGSFIDPAGGL
jgi:NAD(P)-dependent dehydrogenase (short-subunit alcohol dehydrogenase family)